MSDNDGTPGYSRPETFCSLAFATDGSFSPICLETQSRIDLAQKSAGHRRQQVGMQKMIARGNGFPGFVGDGVRDPQVAVVDVVFDENESATRAQIFENLPKYLILVGISLKVKRIGHHNSIKKR